MGQKKKTASLFIRLVSAAGTGFFYVKRKNPKRIQTKLEFRKYDPRVNRHVLFTEAKMKHSGESPATVKRKSDGTIFDPGFTASSPAKFFGSGDPSNRSSLYMLKTVQIIMGRKRKPDHPRRMMSDVLYNRTSVAPPSEEASHRPPSEWPRPPSEGPFVPPHRPPSVAPQQLPCTQPPHLPSVRPPSVAPQQLSSRLESSAYEPSADPSTSSQPTSVHVSSSLTSTRRGRGWDNVAKLTTQLGIIVRNGNIVPLTFLDWNNVPDDIVDAIWKDVKWEEFVEYWRISDAEKIATRNVKNRRAHGIAHTTGRTTFAQIQHEMSNKGESTDKMNVWLMTRRVDDPEDEFNRQLSMLPEDGQTLEARNAIFHELIGHDGHGYCRTYGRTVPWRAVYKDGARPSQSTPQPSTIV
ncbi:hypothetical protein TEA_011606 [Camellia sinensis var. sinensis]|uniref:Large ribosomal subunit protein bL33c n=2 Tax=Camellia sinensis TaxID=4442 RepID=A0A4S4EMV3_CAMSN|nr:hypothetical protein TEA_011606 [Camellia sinensis var. sinensis]